MQQSPHHHTCYAPSCASRSRALTFHIRATPCVRRPSAALTSSSVASGFWRSSSIAMSSLSGSSEAASANCSAIPQDSAYIITPHLSSNDQSAMPALSTGTPCEAIQAWNCASDASSTLIGCPFAIGNNFSAMSHGSRLILSALVLCNPALTSFVRSDVPCMICPLPCSLWFCKVVSVVPLLHVLAHSRPMSPFYVAEKYHFFDRNFASNSRLFVLPFASNYPLFLISPPTRLRSRFCWLQQFTIRIVRGIVSELFGELFLFLLRNCFPNCFWLIFRLPHIPNRRFRPRRWSLDNALGHMMNRYMPFDD